MDIFKSSLIAPSIVLMLSANLFAQESYTIQSDTLQKALEVIAKKSKLPYIVEESLIKGKESPSIKEVDGVQSALNAVLKNTNLEAVIKNGTIIIKKKKKSDTSLESFKVTELSPLVVRGTAPARYESTHSGAIMGVDVALIDTPRTIQVIPEQLILDQQAQDLRDVMKNISGVTTRNETGGTTEVFIVRGFETFGTVQDGMPIPRFTQRMQTADIERVEVIKGPSSNLLGRSYPGGVINVITKKPLKSSRKVISATFDKFGKKASQLDLTGPLNSSENIFYRMVMAYEDTKTFRETNQKTEVKRLHIAPSLTWEISDTDRVTYSFKYHDNELPIDEGAVVYQDPNTGKTIYSDRFKHLGEPGDSSKEKRTAHHLDYEHDLTNGWLVSAKTGYQDRENSGFRNNPKSVDATTKTLIRNQYKNEQETQRTFGALSLSGEFKTGSLTHKFATGIDYNKLHFDTNFQGGASTPINIQNPVYGTSPTESAFIPAFTSLNEFVETQVGFRVQDMVSFDEDWVLSAGVRVDSFKFDRELNGKDSELKSDGEVSPNLGLIYHASPYFSPFISYSESFTTNFPGYNNITKEFVNAPPSEGKQYEMGLKGAFGRNKINYNLTYFDLSFTNMANGRDDTGAPIYDGKQASKGFEFDANIQFSKGLYMLLNLSKIDTEVKIGSRKGNELLNAPNFLGNLWLTYEHQDGSFAGLGYGGGIRHVGKRFADSNNAIELDSYTTFDLTAHYYMPIKEFNSKLRLQAGIKNVLDEEYYVPNSGAVRLGMGQPRTIYASIGVEF